MPDCNCEPLPDAAVDAVHLSLTGISKIECIMCMESFPSLLLDELHSFSCQVALLLLLSHLIYSGLVYGVELEQLVAKHIVAVAVGLIKKN
jgi:hypothetical protein